MRARKFLLCTTATSWPNSFFGEYSPPETRRDRRCRAALLRGLSVKDPAAVLGVSVETVKRDWRLAKLWLLREMLRGACL